MLEVHALSPFEQSELLFDSLESTILPSWLNNLPVGDHLRRSLDFLGLVRLTVGFTGINYSAFLIKQSASCFFILASTTLRRRRDPIMLCIAPRLWSSGLSVLNYARENAHLKATYKNLFESISVSRTQTKEIIASLQNELQSTIYKIAKLRTQLFEKVYDQKDNTQDTSENTKFAKQPIVENLPKVGETNALSNPVTSNSVSTPQESKGVNNDKVIAPGMFRINPFKTSMKEKHVPSIVSASARTKPITVSQPPVITKKDVNSDVNGLSSIGVDNTKTRRP
nr:hypothetical protein [Tanacetum cinerariifolium]